MMLEIQSILEHVKLVITEIITSWIWCYNYLKVPYFPDIHIYMYIAESKNDMKGSWKL